MMKMTTRVAFTVVLGLVGSLGFSGRAWATTDKVVVDPAGGASKAKVKAKKALRDSSYAARDEIEAVIEVLGAAEPAVTAPVKAAKTAPVEKEVLVYRTGTGLEPVPFSGAPAGAVVLKPFGAKKLESLVREIPLRTSLEEKRELVARRAEKYYFSSAEAETIVRAFDFDRDRVKVAAILWPVIVDPTNFERVIEVLGSNKAKKKLKEAIGWTR
jgi:hypothetical protein